MPSLLNFLFFPSRYIHPGIAQPSPAPSKVCLSVVHLAWPGQSNTIPPLLRTPEDAAAQDPAPQPGQGKLYAICCCCCRLLCALGHTHSGQQGPPASRVQPSPLAPRCRPPIPSRPPRPPPPAEPRPGGQCCWPQERPAEWHHHRLSTYTTLSHTKLTLIFTILTSISEALIVACYVQALARRHHSEQYTQQPAGPLTCTGSPEYGDVVIIIIFITTAAVTDWFSYTSAVIFNFTFTISN